MSGVGSVSHADVDSISYAVGYDNDGDPKVCSSEEA